MMKLKTPLPRKAFRNEARPDLNIPSIVIFSWRIRQEKQAMRAVSSTKEKTASTIRIIRSTSSVAGFFR